MTASCQISFCEDFKILSVAFRLLPFSTWKFILWRFTKSLFRAHPGLTSVPKLTSGSTGKWWELSLESSTTVELLSSPRQTYSSKNYTGMSMSLRTPCQKHRHLHFYYFFLVLPYGKANELWVLFKTSTPLPLHQVVRFCSLDATPALSLQRGRFCQNVLKAF
jgi:hypothetical protein